MKPFFSLMLFFKIANIAITVIFRLILLPVAGSYKQ